MLALQNPAPTAYLHEHPSPIRHLAFSPDGEFLASCSWDNATIIWKVWESFQIHRRLEHLMCVAGQVAWSPNGRLLFTKLHKNVWIWDAMVWSLFPSCYFAWLNTLSSAWNLRRLDREGPNYLFHSLDAPWELIHFS